MHGAGGSLQGLSPLLPCVYIPFIFIVVLIVLMVNGKKRVRLVVLVCRRWGVICAADLLCYLADPRGGAVGKVRPSGAPAHGGLNTLVGGDSCRDTVRQPGVSVTHSRLHLALVSYFFKLPHCQSFVSLLLLSLFFNLFNLFYLIFFILFFWSVRTKVTRGKRRQREIK